MKTTHTPGPWSIGDEVIYTRAKSSWGRIGTEQVWGTVIAVYPKRVRIKLRNNIVNSLTALVDPARLERAPADAVWPK